MEFANLTKRNVAGAAVPELRKTIDRIGELKSERSTATAGRRAAIDAEIRRLNEHCETITQNRG
jgi:hypothetical protein